MRLSLLDLQPGTDYSIQVRGNGGEQGNSEWSPIFLLTTIEDTILPSIPSSVTWVVSGDSFVGKWDPVTTNVNADPITVVRYELELTVSGDTEIVAVPQSTEGNPSFTLTFENNRALFATPRAAVGMRVRAVDNKDLKSNWSSLITATNPAPANPTSVVATAGQDLVSLKWTEATDTDIIGYNVYIGATKLAFVAGTTFIYNTTTYSPTVLTVKSVDKFGQESTGANSNSVTPISPFGSDTTAPGVPTALAAVLTNNPNESGAVAEVTWTMSSPPSDLAGFVVRYRRTGTTNWYQVTTDKDARALTVPLDRSYADYDFQIKAFDWQANESAFSTTATGSGGTNSAPSTPAAPTATANTMMAQVYHNGQKAAGGAMESDVVSYEVHVATSSAAFATSSATYIGTIDATGPVLGGLFPLPATGGTTTQTWYIKVIAVDRGGLKSAASAAVSSGIGLIGATNIIDATITNAKIADLAANKITAGTGIINDITVKSKLTLGDASTVGTIETYDYTNSSGATGAQFSKNGIIIKTGAIEAAALKIQVGENIMPAEYADFEAYPTWYNTQLSNFNASLVVSTTTPQFNSQMLTATRAGLTANLIAYLAPTTTSYNMPVEVGEKYIVSAYIRNRSAVTTTVGLGIKWDNAANSQSSQFAIPISSSTWVRYSFVTTAVPSGVAKGLVFVQSNTTTVGAQFDVDGIQVEKQLGNLTTPSRWTPPGATTINGDMIRTGSITSTGLAMVTRAWPVYDETGGIIGYSPYDVIADPASRPAWTINAQGNAEFSNLNIRGNAIIGNPSGTTAGTGTLSVSVTTTSGSPTITAADGTFYAADAGNAISGAGIPVGATIAAYVSTSTVTLSANATASATITATLTRPVQIVSSLASANYLPGGQGWIIRSDGHAEFLSVAIGSFDGKSIRAGTVDVGALRTGTLQADIALSGSFQTVSNPTDVTAALTSASTTITLDSAVPTELQFSSSDVGITVAGDGIPPDTTILVVTSGTVATMSAAATATNATASVRLYRGRVATLSGTAGLTLTDQYGNDIVKLPTDPTQPNYFSGSINATDIYVKDEFRMFGEGNSLGQGAKLGLEGGEFKPATAPNVAFDYAEGQQKNLTAPYSMLNDDFQNDENGAIYDPTNNRYYWTYNFFGARVGIMDSNYNYVTSRNYGPGFPASGYWVTYGGMTMSAGHVHFLAKNTDNSEWRHISFARSTLTTTTALTPSDMTNNHVWSAANTGGIVGTPAIDSYGGNTYVAKKNSTGKIVIYKYTGAGLNATAAKSTVTGTISSGNIASVRVGKFDMGGTNTYIVVSTVGTSSAHRQNFTFVEGPTEFSTVSYHFPTPYDKTTLAGLCYRGASADDPSGYFQSFMRDGKVYDHTQLGHLSTTTTMTVSQKWRYDAGGGTGTIGPEGPIGTVSYKRRSRMVLTSRSSIPNTGAPTPNSLTFYASNGAGTRYRYDEPAIGIVQQTFTQFRTTDASGPTTSMATGIPAQLFSNSGLVINGNGEIYGPYTPKRVLSGSVNITFSGTQVATQAVSFPVGYFTSAPVVTVTPVGSSVFAGSSFAAPTTSGFTAQGIRLVTSGLSPTHTGTIAFHWVAVQQT